MSACFLMPVPLVELQGAAAYGGGYGGGGYGGQQTGGAGKEDSDRQTHASVGQQTGGAGKEGSDRQTHASVGPWACHEVL
jgi:hypothetical protein